MKTRWTEERLKAVIQACEAMLAGEEGEGDAEGVDFDDLKMGVKRLREELKTVHLPGAW